MAALMQKSCECMTCKKQIRLSKIDNPPTGQKKRWEKYELDGTTLHVCNSEKQIMQKTGFNAEELKAIRDLLIAATRRIDAIIAEKT